VPRDLSDVLHYFMPEAGEPRETGNLIGGEWVRDALPSRRAPASLPLVAVPIGDRDVVRAALTWNLSVEVARLGGRALLVAPASDGPSPLWPINDESPVGAEISLVGADSLGELYRAAQDLAVARAVDAEEGGIVFVRVPPLWLRKPTHAEHLLRWTLLLTSPEPRELLETYGIAKLLTSILPSVRMGVTVHGVRKTEEGSAAFRRLDDVARRRLSHPLVSYGLLVDDLDVYRAIVAQRPIGLAHPQSAAARTLGDVASLLLKTAQERAVV
jgi:hypothetical protein